MTRTGWVLGASAILLTIGMVIGLTQGPARLELGALTKALFAQGSPSAEILVWQLRMPRVFAAVVVGASLAAAGWMLQGSTRNPLGDPQLFGVGGGAVVVQALALAGVVRLGVWGHVGLSVAASLMGAGLIAVLAARQGISPTRLALVGVSLAALAAAVATGILAEARVFTQQSLMFLGGSLANRGWADIIPALPWMAVGLALAAHATGRLNLLALGDRVAANLGGEPGRTRTVAFLASGFLGGAAVAVAGLVGFVGFMVPHLARLLVGHDARRVLVAAVPLGAVGTLYADQVARLAFMPSELPAGFVTAVLGAPIMMYMASRIT